MPTNQLDLFDQSLYPRHDTLQEAIAHAAAQLPIEDTNQLVGVLKSYHNTLLHEQRQEKWT